MFTACELCVCATYSAEMSMSRGLTVIVVTSSGGGGSLGTCLPQAASSARQARPAAEIERQKVGLAKRMGRGEDINNRLVACTATALQPSRISHACDTSANR